MQTTTRHHLTAVQYFLKYTNLLDQAASSHVKRLVGERGDWEVEVERLRSIIISCDLAIVSHCLIIC